MCVKPDHQLKLQLKGEPDPTIASQVLSNAGPTSRIWTILSKLDKDEQGREGVALNIKVSSVLSCLLRYSCEKHSSTSGFHKNSEISRWKKTPFSEGCKGTVKSKKMEEKSFFLEDRLLVQGHCTRHTLLHCAKQP